jgi:hypothetical protein
MGRSGSRRCVQKSVVAKGPHQPLRTPNWKISLDVTSTSANLHRRHNLAADLHVPAAYTSYVMTADNIALRAVTIDIRKFALVYRNY